MGGSGLRPGNENHFSVQVSAPRNTLLRPRVALGDFHSRDRRQRLRWQLPQIGLESRESNNAANPHARPPARIVYGLYNNASPDCPWRGGSANIAAGPLELPDLARDSTGTPKVSKGQVKRSKMKKSRSGTFSKSAPRRNPCSKPSP